MSPPARARTLLAALAWAAALALAGGLGAWSLTHSDPAGTGTHADPLDDAEVRRQLDKADPPSTGTPSPSHTPSASSNGTATPHRTVHFSGGSATAQCLPDGSIHLSSWSPAAGYTVEEATRGPARTAVLELEPSADDGEDKTVTLHCANGRPTPVALPAEDADDAVED
ncbi:hypothetical protein [Streptomyces boninensis]|uniref:hypothetical protein n=1 Tax=Streptomyces boninensis TaxID=2039455 RepID=UPI003B211D73